MKLLPLLFLVTAPYVTNARYMEGELERLSAKLQDLQRLRAEHVAHEEELRAGIEAPQSTAAESARLHEELDEAREVNRALAPRETELRRRIKEQQTSPEYRISKTIQSDKRHPTKANISGVWTSGPNLTVYNIQLEQRATSVTGRGYYWGCTGIFDVFKITGSYRNGTLSLSFHRSSGEIEKKSFRYKTERNRPRFRIPNSDRDERIMPSHELH